MKNIINAGIIGLVVLILCVLAVPSFIETVPAGHVKVGTMFGKVQQEVLDEGIHLVNPMLSWHKFDCREKTQKIEKSAMPSNDQLTTKIDWSVQYRANCAMASQMLKDTGKVAEVVEVHLMPNFRSIIRSRGKSVERAEDYFSETVQTNLQAGVLSDLQAKVASKGIVVSGTLLRNVSLPPVIQKAIEQKKQRQQETEKQQAELERFRVEQEQKVAQAQAEADAAKLEAEKIATLARAEADANRLVASSLTASLVNYRAVETWDGALPGVTGGAVPFINLGGK